MDAVQATNAGWNIGVIAGEEMLKYDRGVYEDRLVELKKIKDELAMHLENLNQMKGKIPGFWDDMLGDKLSDTLQTWTKNIQEADDKIQSMIVTTEDLMAGLDEQLGSAEASLDSAKSVASAVSGAISGLDSLK